MNGLSRADRKRERVGFDGRRPLHRTAHVRLRERYAPKTGGTANYFNYSPRAIYFARGFFVVNSKFEIRNSELRLSLW